MSPPPSSPATSPEPTLEDLDRSSLFHPFTSIQRHLVEGPLVITDASGVRVRDRAGREYIDAMAGLWCVNVGYGRRELVEAMTAQASRLPYYHSFASMSNEPVIRLAARLIEMAPGRMSKVFFANSGSEANDTQIKLVRAYNNLRGRPEKKKILSRRAAYHGVTLGATSLSGLPPMHAIFDLPLPGFLHLERPSHYWNAPPGASEEEFSDLLATELETVIEREGASTIAAMFVEPVQGAGGVIVPPRGYFERIVPILRAHDILLVADEVICGFGRLGTLFGSSYYGLEPDLVTIAKGLTSGYLPMSAVLVGERVWEGLREGSAKQGPFAHGYTYSGHPVPAAVAHANLDLMERENLVAKAAQTGAYLQQRLRAAFADHPLVGEVRGVGMIAGIELVASRSEKRPFPPAVEAGSRLSRHLLAGGLISRALRDTLAFSPPLVLEKADVDQIVEIFGRGLDAVGPELG
ncbi:MAG TPA: aminotransferase [Thermoanaerobaculia bacterium]|nr:aminotransferase [Thermoanaerobaculia bacterium]